MLLSAIRVVCLCLFCLDVTTYSQCASAGDIARRWLICEINGGLKERLRGRGSHDGRKKALRLLRNKEKLREQIRTMAEKKKQREKNDKEKARKEARKARKQQMMQNVESEQDEEPEETRTDFAKLLKPKVKEKILKYLRSLAPPLPDDIDSEEAKEFQLTDDELLGGLRDEVLNISSIEELDDTITSKKSQREYMIEKQQKIMKMPEAEEENIDKRIIKEAEEELEEESSNLDGEEDQDQDQDQNGNQSSDEVSSPSQQSSADNVGKKDVSSVSLQEDPDNPNRSANPFTDDLFESDGESSRKIGSKRGPKLSRSQKKKKLTNSKTFYDNLDIERNL